MDRNEARERLERQVDRALALRAVAVGAAVLLLMIPLAMVRGLVAERGARLEAVRAEIADLWGGDQRLVGPVLAVPVTVTPRGERRGGEAVETVEERLALLLPDTLEVEAELDPEVRRRGIYRVPVYTAGAALRAGFADLERRVARLLPPGARGEAHWERARLVLGVGDPRGIVSAGALEAGGRSVPAEAGTGIAAARSGISWPAAGAVRDSMKVRLEVTLRGSGEFGVLPLGGRSRVEVRSPWTAPSVAGGVMPRTLELGDGGFRALWEVSSLARATPQELLDGIDALAGVPAAAVRLHRAVTVYTLADRATKYGFFVVGLTFVMLGLAELAWGVRPALVQYLLAGAALVVFFLLLLALAEHLGFGPAYLLGALTIAGLDTAYCAALTGWPRALAVMGAPLAVLYGVLYLILRSEDHALLAGTLVVLAALALAMRLTRGLGSRGTGA